MRGTGEFCADDDSTSPALSLLEVTYFTDPLCPWSWALEPQCRRLRLDYGDRLTWRSVMGGMIADWRSYHDPLNAVHNPAQMGLQCYQVRQLTRMPLDEGIWRNDPPCSSYPACLAVKAAERQSLGAGEAYLRRAREAVMLRGRNIARGEVLMELAEELAGDPTREFLFDVERFVDDLLGSEVKEALHDDLRQIAIRNISRFPTLVLRVEGKPGIVLAGYRPWEIIRRALVKLIPDAPPQHGELGLIAYLSRWKRATGHEVAEAFGIDRQTVLRLLHDALETGAITREESLPDGYRIRGS
jgi:predicted DsbA family dithiol-disulfide isomerase